MLPCMASSALMGRTSSRLLGTVANSSRDTVQEEQQEEQQEERWE